MARILLAVSLALLFSFVSYEQGIAQTRKAYKKTTKFNRKRVQKAPNLRKRSARKGKTYSRRRPPRRKISTSFSALSLRHYQGLRALELNGGVTQFGSYYGLGFSQYLNNKSYFKASGFSEVGEANEVEYRNFGADVIYNYTLLTLANTFFLNAGLGATVGWDQITNTEVLDIDSEVNAGGLINAEAELFLGNKFSIVLQANQRVLLKATHGDRRWFAGLGLKCTF